MLASYERVKDRDQAFVRALGSPGVTINIAAADVVWDRRGDAMKEHVERYRMAHTLATLTRGPITELASAICLYRADAARPYSERDRGLFQALVPHLVALYDRSRIQYLTEIPFPERERNRRAAAIVDGEGMLHGANAPFVTLLLSESPQWHGPILPRDMVAAIRATGRSAVLTRVVAKATAVNDLFLVSLREIAPCDDLSEREWDVAVAFGDGMSHKDVARRLGIAPSTVRNHLSAVYAKLGVSNKAELVNALKAAPR